MHTLNQRTEQVMFLRKQYSAYGIMHTVTVSTIRNSELFENKIFNLESRSAVHADDLDI